MAGERGQHGHGGPLPGGARGQPSARLCLLGSIPDPPYYRQTRETSVYLSPGATGRGLGTRLYAEQQCLHRSLGFTEVGTLDEIGFKFGACIGTAWFQLLLG